MDEIRWWHTSFGEEEIQKIAESINAEHISQGPVTEEFEARFAAALNVPFAVATTSGSVSLLMALMALGIGKGDEVIVPNRTFIAAAHAAMLLGAEIVLVDVVSDLPVMDIDQLRQKITPRTKAIIPVHLNGRSNDMERINQIAKEHGLAVVEDACQSLFSRNASGYLGTQSDAGCFSLGVTKLISTGQGGVVVTDNEETYERLKLVRNHGVDDTFEATYEHVGLNFKFTDLLSSIGLVQLSKIPERLTHMNAIYERYDSAFDEYQFPFIKIIPVNVEAGEVPLWVEVLCEDRPKMMTYLQSKGIQTRRFLPDLDDSPHLKNNGEFPNSRMFGDHGVFMPCGPSQSLDNIDRVIDALRKF
jgi:perosamine synthetase